MGCGIAQVLAQSFYDVILCDKFESQLEKAKKALDKNVAKFVEKKKISDGAKVLSHIAFQSTFENLEDTDCVIEAINEKEDLKISLFNEIQNFVKKDTIFASNTSSISITKLASKTDRPEKFIGLHFMNPVPLMDFVELIPGLATSDETVSAMLKIIESINKKTAVSKDFPGFIVNRILIPMINEAVFLLMEGVAVAKEIDDAMVLGTNQPMGPLALADLIGLDTCLSIMNVLYDGFKDPKYRPCSLLEKYVSAGWLGRKTGKGFYVYQ